MSAIPLELITLLGSSIIAGIMQLWSKSIEARKLERTYYLQALNAKANVIHEARRYENRGFQWTRRIIALTTVFFVIAFPKLVAVYYPLTEVHIGYTEATRHFLFLFGGHERMRWEAMNGLVITSLDTHLLSAIIGLYFGGSLTKN